ncbi:helix-turn-helix domain-containing protein [Bacillus niameyensis]|uniref:helix-turn-helix domain-containing protein n=1 Tax=Bacillus niameyensis TaxID=1522308 RepID=UPI000840FEC2|nr:helix-turn-helix transcriptional regulator [Bacillus niameyensis]
MSNGILPKRLKKLREEHGYLQKFVADKLGIRSNTLSGYENGSRSPDPEMLVAISELYNVTTDYLLGRTDDPNLNISKISYSMKPLRIPQEQIDLAMKHQNYVLSTNKDLSFEDFVILEELKKHPILFHDLATNPEKKIKELLKLYKMKKILQEDDEDDLDDGFGELDD